MKNPAAALAAMRKTETRACERCGDPATGLKGQVRYCSKACKQAAYRDRKRAG